MNPLLKLVANNKGRGFFRAETNGDEATIYVYDVIVSDAFFGGVEAKAFVQELNKITASVIHLRINSPGGDVFAARAMEQAIREHAATVIAHVDGYAASAASFLAIACDEIEIAPGGFFMIHKAWTCVCGNSDDLQQTSDLLNKIDDSLAQTYAEQTGKSAEEIKSWMADETWFTAEEAVENGFADRVAKAGDKKASATWDMSAYHKAPIQKEGTADIQETHEKIFINTDELRRRLQLVATAA